MPNYGLLSNMADGIKEGLIAYQTVSNAKQQQKQTDRAFQMQKLKEGMQENAEGQIGYTPERQMELDQERKNRGLLAQHQAAEISPESEESQRASQYYTAQGLNIPEGMSAKEARDIGAGGLLSHKASNEEQEKLAKMRFDAAREERADKRAEGKQIPASEAMAFGGSDASLEALANAQDLIKKNQDLTGPFAGRASALAGKFEVGETGQRAKILDAQLKLNAQNVGKYLEGGKLTDADIDRYKQMLPNLNDSEQAAAEKTKILENMINRKKQLEMQSLGKAGYNVKGLLGGESQTQKAEVPEDQWDAAEKYANEHPDDPYSQRILKAIKARKEK